MKCENALPAGTRLNGTQEDQYEILSVLGAGGFGITYKARDHLLQSDVAIKEYLPLDLALRDANGLTVKPRASNQVQDYDWGLERFLDEARTLSRFKAEPNIVRVENFLPANGTAYMVMQYEDGESLSEYLSRHGVLDEDQLKAILFPILDGLRAIHAEGFLHRDIKPANIYLRKNGTPILLDFGAARQALGDHSRSVTGILTAGYAPFEQYSTRSKLTAATDLYALGATLYKCITGQVPVEATERINAMHNDEADPLIAAEKITSEHYSDVIYESLNWLMRPLAKDRPCNVEEVLEKLVPEKGSTSHATGLSAADIAPDAEIVTTKSARQKKEATRPKRMGKRVVGNYKLVLLPIVAIAILVVIIIFVLRSPGGDEPSVVAPDSNQPLVIAPNSNQPSVVVRDYDVAKKHYNSGRYLKAFVIFQKLANKNHVLSEFYISEIWRFGYGKPKNSEKSKYWFQRALANGLLAEFRTGAKAGQAEAQFLLGNMYFRGTGVGKDYKVAAMWISKSANQDYAVAQLNLGYMYEHGLGVTKDVKQAVSWYRKSALAGNSIAQSNLGYMFSLGRGVEKNVKKAIYWYRKSAALGNASGQVNLGFMYNTGRGVQKDNKQAIIWYRKSAVQGNKTAQFNMGYMVANGNGVTKNIPQAIVWYRKSARQNNVSAQLALAYYYKKGLGIPRNDKTAVDWYRKSAMLGSSSGQFQLGLMYAAGRGVKKDDKQAVDWFRKSAAQGNMSGQRALGIMHETGRGTPVNLTAALIWYNKSQASGNANAAKDIRRVKNKKAGGGHSSGGSSNQPGGSGRFEALFK